MYLLYPFRRAQNNSREQDKVRRTRDHKQRAQIAQITSEELQVKFLSDSEENALKY
jgi:hypothetical protein